MEPGGEQVRQSAASTAGDAGARVALFVPSLLEGLAADDEETVRSAGYGLCSLVREHPDNAGTVVDPLVAEFVAAPTEGPILWTLATLVDRVEETIHRALLSETSPEEASAFLGYIREAPGWEPDGEHTPTGENDDVVRLIKFEQSRRKREDPAVRHVQREPARESDVPAVSENGSEPDAADEDDAERSFDPEAAAERTGSRPRAVRKRHERIRQVEESEPFRIIESRSRFDELHVLRPPRDRRYAKSVRTRAVEDGEERGVAIRLCTDLDGSGYEEALLSAFRAWQDVEVGSVVQVLDWGKHPRPWIATATTDDPLACRDRLSPKSVLVHAHVLSAALSELHGRDVVHGGIDPNSVVYAADALRKHPRPLFDNLGLLEVYRSYDNPAEYLDPRFAAPEYFDPGFGDIDHQTDIYQLGMVLYRAATGSVPFSGDFAAIREAVCKDHPPAPSRVVEAMPAGFDEILAKATAKQKLTRYESAAQLHRDVEDLIERLIE